MYPTDQTPPRLIAADGRQFAYYGELMDYNVEVLDIPSNRWIPSFHEEYYTPDVVNEDFFVQNWAGSPVAINALRAGLVFKTKEEAIACARHLSACARSFYDGKFRP